MSILRFIWHLPRNGARFLRNAPSYTLALGSYLFLRQILWLLRRHAERDSRGLSSGSRSGPQHTHTQQAFTKQRLTSVYLLTAAWAVPLLALLYGTGPLCILGLCGMLCVLSPLSLFDFLLWPLMMFVMVILCISFPFWAPLWYAFGWTLCVVVSCAILCACLLCTTCAVDVFELRWLTRDQDVALSAHWHAITLGWRTDLPQARQYPAAGGSGTAHEPKRHSNRTADLAPTADPVGVEWFAGDDSEQSTSAATAALLSVTGRMDATDDPTDDANENTAPYDDEYDPKHVDHSQIPAANGAHPRAIQRTEDPTSSDSSRSSTPQRTGVSTAYS